MMELSQRFSSIALIVTLFIVPTAIEPQVAQGQTPKPPPPPNTGTPVGNPTPATTRPQVSCPKTNKPLTALIANNRSDYTLSEYPTFWFYIPYSTEQIGQLEFILLNGSERQTIYQAKVKLTHQPGMISITIPSTPQYALKPNETYRWYLMLDCQKNQNDEPGLVVDGWIIRLDSTSQQSKQIWYDTINNLAQKYFANPTNPEIKQAWINLLNELNQDKLVQEPLADWDLTSLSE